MFAGIQSPDVARLLNWGVRCRNAVTGCIGFMILTARTSEEIRSLATSSAFVQRAGYATLVTLAG